MRGTTCSPSPRAQLRGVRLFVFRNGLAEALRRLDELERVAEAHGDDALRLDVLLERGYAHWHTGDCAAGRRAYAEALVLLEHLRPDLGEAPYRANGCRRCGAAGSSSTTPTTTPPARRSTTAGRRAGARELRDGPEEARALRQPRRRVVGLLAVRAGAADLRRGAVADPAAFYARGRAASVLGRGIVLGSIGRYEEAARLLAEGLDVFRGLGDAWFIVYGLVYLSAVRAGQGDLRRRARGQPRGRRPRRAAGIGYPLALARAHLLWQEEVRAPGHAETRPDDRGGPGGRPAARPPRPRGAPGLGAATAPGRRLRASPTPCSRASCRRRCALPAAPAGEGGVGAARAAGAARRSGSAGRRRPSRAGGGHRGRRSDQGALPRPEDRPRFQDTRVSLDRRRDR